MLLLPWFPPKGVTRVELASSATSSLQGRRIGCSPRSRIFGLPVGPFLRFRVYHQLNSHRLWLCRFLHLWFTLRSRSLLQSHLLPARTCLPAWTLLHVPASSHSPVYRLSLARYPCIPHQSWPWLVLVPSIVTHLVANSIPGPCLLPLGFFCLFRVCPVIFRLVTGEFAEVTGLLTGSLACLFVSFHPRCITVSYDSHSPLDSLPASYSSASAQTCTMGGLLRFLDPALVPAPFPFRNV